VEAIVTREEGLSKDDALAEIMATIRKMPTLVVVHGPKQLGPETVSKVDVLQLIQRYGFN
jgi:hypothetical protein